MNENKVAKTANQHMWKFCACSWCDKRLIYSIWIRNCWGDFWKCGFYLRFGFFFLLLNTSMMYGMYSPACVNVCLWVWRIAIERRMVKHKKTTFLAAISTSYINFTFAPHLLAALLLEIYVILLLLAVYVTSDSTAFQTENAYLPLLLLLLQSDCWRCRCLLCFFFTTTMLESIYETKYKLGLFLIREI